MSTAYTNTQKFNPSFNTETEEKKSIWRRLFDAWVRSHEARLGPDGIPYLDL
jgi:hypothetical protein